MAEITFEGVRKNFGKFAAVDGVDLQVHDREFVVLLGPSGCGKTTLLRCLAGLERVDDGRVFIGGRDATDLPPKRRRIAMVFQSYAVFPHMKVYDNIAFGLRMQKERKPVDRRARPLVGRAAPHRGAARPVLVAALGWAEAACGRRARHRHEGRRAADGRAALEPRRTAPPGDASRAQVAAAAASKRRRSTSRTTRSRRSAWGTASRS